MKRPLLDLLYEVNINLMKIVRVAIGVAVLLLLVWLLGFTARRTENSPTPAEPVRYDTIVVVKHDTLTIRERVKQWQYHYDTIRVHDTVYIADIPQNYVDSTSDYRLEVNAVKMYDYSLDIYRADTLTRYVPQVSTERKKQSRMGFGQSIVVGLQVGYGLGVQPATMQARFEPYVGIGITYGWGYHW